MNLQMVNSVKAVVDCIFEEGNPNKSNLQKEKNEQNSAEGA